MFEMPDFDECDRSEWHALFTIQLGELIEGGFVDWSNDTWKWSAYSEEQYARVCQKFNDRFYWREIGMLPPGKWKQQVVRKFNEIMPKYIPMYEFLENGGDIMAVGGEYGKERHIFSNFPQTALAGNEDYASTGDDREFETVQQGNYLDQAERIQKSYNDVDVMILEEMEVMFCSLMTANVNYIGGI